MAPVVRRNPEGEVYGSVGGTPMLKHSLMVGFFLLAASLTVRAADSDAKKEKPRTEEKKTEVKHKVEVKEDRGGNKFTNFWVHTVGGSIGNGLKSGAHKISNAFD
jgi:hypothetical protein